MENAPCQARPESPARAASAPVLPRFDPCSAASAFSTLRPRRRSPRKTRRGGRRVGNATPPPIETGDVPSDGIGTVVANQDAPAELKRAMFPAANLLPSPQPPARLPNWERRCPSPTSCCSSTVVTGAPPELKGAMFPNGRGRPDPGSGRGFPTPRPRVSHRLPTAAVLDLGIASVDSPWKTLPARPGPSRPREPQALRFCRVSTPAPLPARFPRFVHGAGPQTNRRRGGRRVGNATPPPIETGDVPCRRSPAVVATTTRLPNWKRRCPSPTSCCSSTVVTGAPPELKGAMFPTGGTGRTPRSERRFPTTRPRVSHRLPTAAVLVWGSRPWTARGKRSLPGPARVARASRKRSGSAAFRPLLRCQRVFHASSTAPVPEKNEARWSKGGKRNSALYGAMFPSTPQRTFPGFETGDVPSRRRPAVVAVTGAPAELKGAILLPPGVAANRMSPGLGQSTGPERCHGPSMGHSPQHPRARQSKG